jgi:hypothetical protein
MWYLTAVSGYSVCIVSVLWVLPMSMVVVPEIIVCLKRVEQARGNGAISGIVSVAVAHKVNAREP